MFLQTQNTGDRVEVINLAELSDVFEDKIHGRYQAGEELQDVEVFNKSSLLFLSGEALPVCWTDPHYRDKEFQR
ncbi:acetyltransferase [Psychromonas sp. Urea-02u-13]|jgi:hypothetical protein|uniref:acetyltransferase n=1 Tax=Psychromonas sp. Urea-02u-13 TaxID=2058326 RepID=UPI000C32D934|nr:acetyltransferase [Psychromonas sp. Urea-02u-13]PKG40014.1 acetyltransferase [Psychromonas sp. Urea-02u-13]